MECGALATAKGDRSPSRTAAPARLLFYCPRFFDGKDANLQQPNLTITEALLDTVLESTAQHHGIKTSLLDFTADPAVAVWFACQGASKGDIASVFALPLAMGALCDVGVFLSHPMALRPYRQHGLFIQDSLRQLKLFLIEIRFPVDPDFHIRRDRLPAALLPEDEWWAAVAAATERGSRIVPSLDLSGERVAEAVDESLLHMLHMLMELTTYDVQRNTSFNHNVISQIASQNGNLLLACEKHCGSVGRQHFRGTMGQFVVPQMLDHLRIATLHNLLESSKSERSIDIDHFRKWLPIYKKGLGAILSKVPTDIARGMLELYRGNNVDYELHPEEDNAWIVQINGLKSAK